MKNPMKDRISVRLDGDTQLNIEIMSKATHTAKAKIVRMILRDFFNKNEQILDEYYEKIKVLFINWN